MGGSVAKSVQIDIGCDGRCEGGRGRIILENRLRIGSPCTDAPCMDVRLCKGTEDGIKDGAGLGNVRGARLITITSVLVSDTDMELGRLNWSSEIEAAFGELMSITTSASASPDEGSGPKPSCHLWMAVIRFLRPE